MLINQQRQHLFLHDHSAPDHDIPVVEDDGLPGRDGALRLIKFDFEKVIFRLCDGAGLLFVAIAYFGAAAKRTVDAVHGDQVDLARIEGPLHQVVIGSECDSVGPGIDLRDVAAVRGRNAESAALAERVVDDPLVAPQDIALCVHKIAGRTLNAAVALDEARVVAVRNKADVLAVVLLGIVKTALGSDLSGLGLILVAEWKLHVSKLLLCQNIEHITLILGRVERFQKKVAAPLRIIFCPRVVTGRQDVAAKLFHFGEEMLKLEAAVALDAGIGRAAVQVLIDKRLDDFLCKQVLIMDDMVRDADLLGNAAGILRVLEGAAGVQKIFTYNVIFIQAHRAADAIEAARRHDLSRHAAVNAAAHGN